MPYRLRAALVLENADTYRMVMYDRPKEPKAYAAVASVCITVLGLR